MTPDLDLLEAFVAVADQRSFTAAARLLGLRQSNVSQKIARLEAIYERPLFVRNPHAVALTVQGAALLPLAREVLDASARLGQFAAGRPMRGTVRLGISEDFALEGLVDALSHFRQRHDDIEIELTIGLSATLHQGYDAGNLDVIFAKRQSGDTRGTLAWRERLVWAGRPGIRPDPGQPLPLVIYGEPSVTRTLAIDALDKAARAWKTACTASSLNGLRAAALAGFGFIPHSGTLLPAGLAIVPPSDDLPDLGEIEFVVISRGAPDSPSTALANAMLKGAARLAAQGGL